MSHTRSVLSPLVCCAPCVRHERVMIVRAAFGRRLSKLETALCDAIEKRTANARGEPFIPQPKPLW